MGDLNMTCFSFMYLLQVTRADYLSGRTALHFAAVHGHVRCLRLVVADFVPSAPFETMNAPANSEGGDSSNTKSKNDQRCFILFFFYLFSFVFLTR